MLTLHCKLLGICSYLLVAACKISSSVRAPRIQSLILSLIASKNLLNSITLNVWNISRIVDVTFNRSLFTTTKFSNQYLDNTDVINEQLCGHLQGKSLQERQEDILMSA